MHGANQMAVTRSYPRALLVMPQSSGGDSIPHTLPGLSSINPRNQNFSNSPSGMQFTTRAVTLVLVGRPSRRIADPTFNGRLKRAAHPRVLTRTTRQGSERGGVSSRVVRISSILQLILVPPRASGTDHLSPGPGNSNCQVCPAPISDPLDSSAPFFPGVPK